MSDSEYTLDIDAFTPETLPMARLAEYMAALADLVGFKESTHFVRVDKGSARLVSRVEETEAPKVERRLAAVNSNNPPAGTAKAFKAIDDMLAEDNAIGKLIDPSGVVVVPFPGRTRPRPLAFPAFKQDGSIDGEIVSIGGRDKTAHIILQDGPISYSNISLTKDTAKQLAKFLYGQKVRLFGSGRWERHPEGAWKLINFIVDRYEVLDDAPLAEVLGDVRSAAQGVVGDSVYWDMIEFRRGEGEVH